MSIQPRQTIEIHRRPRPGGGRRGIAFIYVIVALTVLVGFCSLAVDWGHVLVTKTELQHAADAAARHAYKGLALDYATAESYAADAADDNNADGSPVRLEVKQDVEFGLWDKQAKAFTPLTGTARSQSNAVRVTARRSAARGNAVTMMFASLLGKRQFDVQARSVASTTRDRQSVIDVSSQSNPWLAGVGSGTVANPNNPADNPDRAPAQAPVMLSGVKVRPGMLLSFDSIVGAANNGPGKAGAMFTPDGNAADVVHNFVGAEHGKSDVYAPINALMGVFLDDSMPGLAYPPPTLDFSTAASRNFTVLSPRLRQVFFIGDGRNAAGGIQKFTVPAGTTRMYLATMDAYEWNNNSGKFTVTIFEEDAVALVQ
jgi:Flp pilus assembly protein TadG